ncbi:hypothetical protein ABFS83_09G108000 [Erythranthe nasuta]
MADAIISVVLNRLAALMQEQIRSHVNLVRGVDKEVESLSNELNTVRNVLEDAEKKGCKDKSVKDWLTRLENTSYEMDDVLDEWNYSILKFRIEESDDVGAGADVFPSKKKVWSFIPSSCMCFKKVAIRHDIALKIKEVKTRLHLVLAEKDRYGFITSEPIDPSRESWRVQSTSLIDLEEVCGRDLERENMVSKLVDEGGSGKELGVRVISVVGVGGLGKTTLAKLAYNDSRVNNYFQLRIWICVSDTFNEVEIANEIIKGADGSKPTTNQLEMVLQCLKETISGKKFLLVMDDVWTEDDTKWESLRNCLKCGGVGSKILVTTRNERVAIMMGTVKNDIHLLGHLSDEHCSLLLGRIALSRKNKEEYEKFESIGRNIASKCKGLPLAAKTLGSLLRFKNTVEEWESVLNSEIWKLEEVEVELFPHLVLSYNELSPTLKRCFSYCAVFPKDTRIDVKTLITEWMALGYLESNDDWEVRGREYFDKLAMRSLFQDFDKRDLDERIISFKMHDIVHDFAQFLRKNVGSKTRKRPCQDCSPLLVSQVEKYRSLFPYKGLPNPHVGDCLKSVRLLSLRSCGLKSIPKGIEKLIGLRWLDLGLNEFSVEDLNPICKLYNLQFLRVDGCHIEEIPSEIGNLIQLKQLDLSDNQYLMELPDSVCSLHELESLNLDCCEHLSKLPQGIHKLVNLKHLCNIDTYALDEYPQGLGQLTSLCTLNRFCGGSNKSKLGCLKKLNRISGDFELAIKLNGDSEEEMVEDARGAELREKAHIRNLLIEYSEYVDEHEDWVWVDVIDALEPHPNVQELEIFNYRGSLLPKWIASPLSKLRTIRLLEIKYVTSLPPLGKLQFLENLKIYFTSELEFVGREFLGLTTISSSPNIVIGFPKLKTLEFELCFGWKEWEDISAEEENYSIMPCLNKLAIKSCERLRALPKRLVRKLCSSSLSGNGLDISGSNGVDLLFSFCLPN